MKYHSDALSGHEHSICSAAMSDEVPEAASIIMASTMEQYPV